MTQFGYTLMGEQAGPRQLVADAIRAEGAGFDFAVASDHFYPWLAEQGHSPYAWAVLGAVSQVTERMGLMSFVTCPTRRYHPAVVAQKAATVALLSGGRFTLGLGAGENLNEHVVGPWPHVTQRHDMLVEALEIIKPLLNGEVISYDGLHFSVPEARLYDLPDEPVPVAVAISGPASVDIAAQHADAMVTSQPQGELIEQFERAGGTGKPRYTQVPVCYGPDEATCKKVVREQWRWGTFGWGVLAELPNPRAFAQATENVTAEDVAKQVPCGPDLERHVRAVRDAVDAGFTHVALVQVGAEGQQEFTEWAHSDLLPALRSG